MTGLAQEDVASLREQLDPTAAGWIAEGWAERVENQLKEFLALWKELEALEPVSLAPLAADDVTSTALRPSSLKETFHDEALRVRRSDGGDQVQIGRPALIEAVRTLVEPLSVRGRMRFKVKITGIEADAGSAQTEVRFEGDARGDNSGGLQIRARWRCQWALDADGKEPRLTGITVESYEEVESSTGRWFADRTAALLGHTEAYRDQFRLGLHEWLSRIERTHGMLYFHRNGLAIADVNADGRDDLYVCQPGGLPNRLFLQQKDGTVDDVSRAAGVDWLDHTASALFVDLDNDGDQDLVLATFEGVLVLEQEAPMRFARRLHLPTKDTDLQSLSSVDYDGDGKLDLYLCVDSSDWAARQGEDAPAFVYHDANDGGENRLWRNAIAESGHWSFTDATAEAGLEKHNRRHSLAASWEDVDDDGDQDLYVANDYGQNCLYLNDGGRFEEVASQLGVVDYGSGMSVAWGDPNRDGRSDLYVGNMFSAAGNRLVRQAGFLERSDSETRALYPRFAKGNSLFLQGENGFEEVAEAAGVAMGRWAWSSVFADINNDGWEDLLVANGYITGGDSGDL